jgi:hypothetical protein
MHAVVGVAAAAAVLVSGPLQAQKPALAVVRTGPLTIKGSGFDASERVRLTLTIRRPRAAVSTRASAAGTFTVRFPPLIAIEPCRGTIIVAASGSAGNHASWKRECRPADPQP